LGAEVSSIEVGMRSRLTCKEFVEFLDDYLWGRLPDGERALFDVHLVGCPSCVAYTKSFQQAVRMGQDAMLCLEADVPSQAPEDLVRAILAARHEKA
jgi:anti-sigma factor RsiW